MQATVLMSQKKYKSVIVLKIYFRAHDAFQQHLKTVKNILKLPHCILKITLAQPCKSKNEIMIEMFLVIRHFRTFSLCPNSVNCDHICSCPLKKLPDEKEAKVFRLLVLLCFLKESTLASLPVNLRSRKNENVFDLQKSILSRNKTSILT